MIVKQSTLRVVSLDQKNFCQSFNGFNSSHQPTSQTSSEANGITRFEFFIWIFVFVLTSFTGKELFIEKSKSRLSMESKWNIRCLHHEVFIFIYVEIIFCAMCNYTFRKILIKLLFAKHHTPICSQTIYGHVTCCSKVIPSRKKLMN